MKYPPKFSGRFFNTLSPILLPASNAFSALKVPAKMNSCSFPAFPALIEYVNLQLVLSHFNFNFYRGHFPPEYLIALYRRYSSPAP
jgi:hypothetical protein